MSKNSEKRTSLYRTYEGAVRNGGDILVAEESLSAPMAMQMRITHVTHNFL